MIKTENNNHISSDTELARYLKQTEEIRALSAPQIREIEGADSYRDTLLNNYKQISEYAVDNIKILQDHFYPLLDYSRDLSDQDIRTMKVFSKALSNAANINNLDSPLAYQQALRLLKEAEKKQDDELLILALDELVSTSYVMMAMAERLIPVSDLCMEYFENGLRASERLLEFLDKDKFVKLSDQAKEMVLVNSRYIRVVSEMDGVPGEPEQNAVLMQRMKNTLFIMRDPFYGEQLPDYDWTLHEFRTLEYICSLADYNNEKGYEGEDISFINACTERIKIVYESEGGRFKDVHNTKDIEIYSARNAYFAGKISLEEYKKELAHLTFNDYREDQDDDVQLIMLHAPFEYMLLIDKDNVSEEDAAFLNHFYNSLIVYMHQTPKMGRLTFLLTYLSLILKNFIELPDGMGFETMCLNLLAALHPPTYVHTLSVADFTSCLTRHLIKKSPELFIGMPGYNSKEDVLAHAKEIEDFACHAALCHDFGKLAIIETIITYGRNLMDDEIRAIRAHQSIGAYLLSLFPSTKEYADIAEGHHKWFNDQGGYPDEFKLSDSPYKTIVSLVTCADCLDAATDTVGRSYKTGKSLDELIGEFRAENGTRYAPYVVDLFSDEEVVREIIGILERERDRNYIETYDTLESHDPKHKGDSI